MQLMDKEKNHLYQHPWLVVIVIILMGVGIKTFLLITGRFPFNADEAVVGLMANQLPAGDRRE